MPRRTPLATERESISGQGALTSSDHVRFIQVNGAARGRINTTTAIYTHGEIRLSLLLLLLLSTANIGDIRSTAVEAAARTRRFFPTAPFSYPSSRVRLFPSSVLSDSRSPRNLFKVLSLSVARPQTSLTRAENANAYIGTFRYGQQNAMTQID